MPNQMEKMASDVMGAVKVAKAKIEGLSGVFAQLSREHGEVTALLLRAKMTSDPKVRGELFPTIRRELVSHEKGELTEVYPAFRQQPELLAFAQEHSREAAQLEAQINAIAELSYDDAKWGARFAELVDMVTHHAKEEENNFFPTAQRVLGARVAEELLSRYQRAKAHFADQVH